MRTSCEGGRCETCWQPRERRKARKQYALTSLRGNCGSSISRGGVIRRIWYAHPPSQLADALCHTGCDSQKWYGGLPDVFGRARYKDSGTSSDGTAGTRARKPTLPQMGIAGPSVTGRYSRDVHPSSSPSAFAPA